MKSFDNIFLPFGLVPISDHNEELCLEESKSYTWIFQSTGQ